MTTRRPSSKPPRRCTGVFTRVHEMREAEGADNGRPWDDIVERVKTIIERPGRKEDRVRPLAKTPPNAEISSSEVEERIPRYEEHDWDEPARAPRR